MNAQQENRLSMYYATDQVLGKYEATWTGIAALGNCVTEFRANMVAIEGAVAKQVIDITGYAKSKGIAEEQMIAVTVKIAGATKAYATVAGNAVLQTQMSIAPSTLRDYRDAVVAQACQSIHDASNAVVADLADYGIAAGDLTELQDAIDKYSGLISAPRNAITERKGQTTEIAMLIKDTYKLLSNRMDPLIGLFADSAPEFHRAYFDARIIIDRKGSVEGESEGAEAEAA